MNDTILQSLILNVLTQQQYLDSEKSANELYLINDLDYSEILVINYGTSAYNNITQALESNKLCILKKDNKYGLLSSKRDDGKYVFSIESNGQFINITINSNNIWAEEESQLFATTEYVDNKIGDTEAALDAIVAQKTQVQFVIWEADD